MRLVVDLQPCQTDSRNRGIGRYAMSLVQAIAAELERADELIVAIDMAEAERARDLRGELRRRNVRGKVVAYGYPATSNTDTSPAARKLAGQLRARFYAALNPDALLICNLFETGTCFSTELDWTVLRRVPAALIVHDLIPLLFPRHYLPEGDFVSGWYRSRLDDIRKFDLIMSNSESTRCDHIDHLGIPGDRIVMIGAGFDETLVCPYDASTGTTRLLELGIKQPFVLMVGNGDWRKNTLGALRAFASLPDSLREAHELVLTQAGDDVRRALREEHAELRDQVHILGKTDDATLALLYRECRVLYFPSHYEGFGLPVLEAMALGAPVLTSRAGALPEIVHDPRVLFDSESQAQGVALLARVLEDGQFREEIRHGGRTRALGFTWQKAARKALEALRVLAQQKRNNSAACVTEWPAGEDILAMADACMEVGESGECALENGLRAVTRGRKRRVLVDISEIVRLDAKTGIQRVTRNFFAGLAAIAREKEGAIEVEPFAWTEEGIRYARDYARTQLGVPCAGPDGPVQVQPSDLVFMLDSSWWSPERFDDLRTRVHAAGGEIVWMVYDLIPVRFPETCDPGMPPAFRSWLTHAVRSADGFVCISEATRHDLESFMDDVLGSAAQRPWTRSAHLGCDLDPVAAASPSERTEAVRTLIGKRPYFVALGTLEPRKDYKTIIDAFELLWSRGVDAALLIVGKQGWNVDALVDCIDQHPELGRRFFWVRSANDGDVRYLLEGAAALVQASIWEGFGLPLIEAARLGVPLVVSDIGVFHEVAGDSAIYFPVGNATALSSALILMAQERTCHDTAVRPRTWREASSDLVDVLLPARLPVRVGNSGDLRNQKPDASIDN